MEYWLYAGYWFTFEGTAMGIAKGVEVYGEDMMSM